MEIGTFRTAALASAPVPTVDVPRAQTYTKNQRHRPLQKRQDKTHRQLRRLQLTQITHSPTNNRSLNPENLHSRRHNAPRHSTVLLIRLFNDNNRASLGRVRSGKVPRIIYPMLTWREAMILGVLGCDCWRRAALGKELECCCWRCDLLGGFVSSDYRGEGG